LKIIFIKFENYCKAKNLDSPYKMRDYAKALKNTKKYDTEGQELKQKHCELV
jgi:hypothetical protein